MSGVRKVMLKATFRILLARDKPERALQAAEEAVLPFFLRHFFRGKLEGSGFNLWKEWTQTCRKLNPVLAEHFPFGKIATLSEKGQSQVKDDMPVSTFQQGRLLSSGFAFVGKQRFS